MGQIKKKKEKYYRWGTTKSLVEECSYKK